MRKQQLSSGFTFLELVIVILIVSIATMLGLPMLNKSLEHSRLSGAVEEVVNALQYAQLSVMTTGRKTRVIIGRIEDVIKVEQIQLLADPFDGGDALDEYDLEHGNYYPMPYPLKKGFEYIIYLSNENRFRGVDITSSAFDPDEVLYFDLMGEPSHGGSVTLASRNYQMVVTLDSLTGKVAVSG